MKLISDSVFGLECKSKEKEFSRRLDYLDWYEGVRNDYSNFLKQPLTLGMFVPCDDDGNVLEIPIFEYKKENLKYLKGMELLIAEETNKRVLQYQNAKEKVIFEGFEYADGYLKKEKICLNFKLFKTIEDLIPYNLQINKQI